jgi:hypothetical protein
LRKKVWSSSPLTVFNRWNSKNLKVSIVNFFPLRIVGIRA